ncbi:MAG: hypothetical protein WCO13_10175 [Bacteroidota bacterium]
MTKETSIKLFEQKQVSTHWDDISEKCTFQLLIWLIFPPNALTHRHIVENSSND